MDFDKFRMLVYFHFNGLYTELGLFNENIETLEKIKSIKNIDDLISYLEDAFCVDEAATYLLHILF